MGGIALRPSELLAVDLELNQRYSQEVLMKRWKLCIMVCKYFWMSFICAKMDGLRWIL